VLNFNQSVVYCIEPHLIDGRSRLIEEHLGERHKLVTRDGNAIDCVSVDRRARYVYNVLISASMA
jgi:hypothetical protein